MADRYTWMKTLSRSNRLAIYDVLEDMRSAVQIHGEQAVIPLMPSIIKFPELCPSGSIAASDRYMQTRLDVARLLVRNGILSYADVPQSMFSLGYDTVIEFSAEPANVSYAHDAIRQTLRTDRRPTISHLLAQYAKNVIWTSLGAATVLGITTSSRWPWVIAAVLVLVLLASRLGAQRLTTIPKFVVDVSTVAGGLAAVAAVALTLLHLDTPKPTTGNAAPQNGPLLRK